MCCAWVLQNRLQGLGEIVHVLNHLLVQSLLLLLATELVNNLEDLRLLL